MIKFKESNKIETADNQGEQAKIFDIYDQDAKVGAMYFDKSHNSWIMVTDFWTEDTQAIVLKATELEEAKKTVSQLVEDLQNE